MPNSPKALTGINTPYLGSCNCIGVAVPHLTSKENALLIYHTSAVKGLLPPKGIFIILFKIGIFSVLKVCLPAPKISHTFPPLTRIAS